MNVKLYVNGELAYDDKLPEEKKYNLLSLAINEAVNKGGTAKIVLPKAHPKYDSFSPFSVPVEVYRDGKLRWRGRPIPPAQDDFYGRRTIVCEGELCFLQDAIHRPYSYTGTASDVFSKVIGVYNAAVEPWKRFSVGVVSVASNVELLSKNPENVLETVKKLVDTYGGYIFFDTAEDGSRRINWYKYFPYTCNQTVHYGRNLTDYNSQTDGTGFATRIIPYGATGEDGQRIKINNAGKDYVENAAAIAEHGIIEKSVIYNDVTNADELKARAESEVAVSGLIPAVIQLNTIDMSRQDLSLDSFAVGQVVPAQSEPHGLSGSYCLVSLSEDLVDPKVGGIVLQRELASFNGSAVKTLTGAIAVSQKDLLLLADANASHAARIAVDAQTQAFIFNKLTNNGTVQGLYLIDGQLYVNASYIGTGVLGSSDGKIKIDLTGGASGPVFNTGISTNGVDVRSDEANAPVVFQISADKDAAGRYFANLRMLNTSGKQVAILTETASKDGAGLEVSGSDGKLSAVSQAGNASAGFRLLRNGETIAYFAVDSAGNCVIQGVSSLFATNISGTKVTADTIGADSAAINSFTGTEATIKRLGAGILETTQINAGKKSLYSGSSSVGSSFSVPGTGNFDLFAVRLGDSANTFQTVVLAYKVGNVIRGVGGWSGTSSDYKELYFVSVTFSGDTWTLQDATMHDIYSGGGMSSATTLSIKQVIGII